MDRTIDQLFRSAVSQPPGAEFAVSAGEFERIYADDGRHGRKYFVSNRVIIKNNNREHWWLGCRLKLVVRQGGEEL